MPPPEEPRGWRLSQRFLGRRRRRRLWRSDYHDLGLLFCWENGLTPHPDTITRRFKEAFQGCGPSGLDLHDVRRSYLTAGRKVRIDWKALRQHVGHSDVAFTMRQYVETDLEADRDVATTLAELIIDGSLASVLVGPGTDGAGTASVHGPDTGQGDEDSAA